MDAVASDEKQCNTGKYQDPEGYRISFVAERNSQEPQEPATSARRAELSTRKVGSVVLRAGEIVFSAAVLLP
jgi:hypothetical protein